MPVIEVNGETVHYNVSPYNARKSFAYYKKKIVDAFSKIGIGGRYLEIQWGGAGGYKEDSWAEVLWYVNGQEYKYRCTSQWRDVDNLAAIAQVIEQDSKSIRRGLKSFGQVMNQFAIEFNPDGPKILSPREVLQVDASTKDWDYITFKYKQRAMQLHPDNLETGDPEKFRELQEAYEQLKEEFRK